MKSYRIELTRPSPWPLRLAIASVAVSVLVLAGQGVRIVRSGWGVQSEVMERDTTAPSKAPPRSGVAPEAGRIAGELARIASTDNGLVLDCIEMAANADASVVRIDIDALERRVQLEVDAVGHDAILTLVQGLGQAPCPGPWRLDRWRAAAGGGVTSTLSIDLVAPQGR